MAQVHLDADFFYNKYTVSVIGYKAADCMGDVVDINGKGKMYIVAHMWIEPTTLALPAPHSNLLANQWLSEEACYLHILKPYPTTGIWYFSLQKVKKCCLFL